MLDEISVVECDACEGLWVEAAVFDALCERSRRQRAARAAESRLSLAAQASASELRYVPCLVCGELMFRRQFWHGGRASGVVIDRCKEHGVWLDKRELESVVAFLSSSASTSPPATLPGIPGLEEALRAMDRSERKPPSKGVSASTVGDALALVADLLLGELLG